VLAMMADNIEHVISYRIVRPGVRASPRTLAVRCR
jgi:hypothetical protein